MLSSSGREAAMFTVAGLLPLKPVMLLMPCHMLLGLLLLKCSSSLFLYVRLAALMDLLRSIETEETAENEENEHINRPAYCVKEKQTSLIDR